MKRVGIVTWHYNPNYGGLIQAYALQETIKRLGYEVEFVNFRPDMGTLPKRVIRRFKDVAIFSIDHNTHVGRRKKYEFIREQLCVGDFYSSYGALANQADSIYDIGVCGSDQIWSNNTGKLEPVYYLSFLNKRKRISYAPSIGYSHIPVHLQEAFKEHIEGIRFLSVREQKGAELIKELTGKKAKVVLDPSFLLRKEDWLEKVEQNNIPRAPTGKFILVYLLGQNNRHVEFARRLSDKTGYDIIALETKTNKFAGLRTFIGDPFDFIELINRAEYIVTDSFHGVALSINLEKEFFAFKRFADLDPNSQNSRIYNILGLTGLQTRLVSSDQSLDGLMGSAIDYQRVNPLLKQARKESLQFLSNALAAVAASE